MWSVIFDDIYFNGRICEFYFSSLQTANRFYILYKIDSNYNHVTLKHYSK